MRPPLWQYGIIIVLFAFCLGLAFKLSLNLSAKNAPAQVTTAAATVVPAPTTLASVAATAYVQPSTTIPIIIAYPTKAGTDSITVSNADGGAYASSTTGFGVEVAGSTPLPTAVPTVPVPPLRIRPIGPAGKG